MKTLHKFLALAALTPILAACTPTPKKVCGHVTEIVNKSAKEGDPEPSEDDKKEQVDKCVGELEKRKKDLGEEKYNKMVQCVMEAKDMGAVIECNAEADKAE